MGYATKVQEFKQKLEEIQSLSIEMSYTAWTFYDEIVCPDCRKHEGIY